MKFVLLLGLCQCSVLEETIHSSHRDAAVRKCTTLQHTYENHKLSHPENTIDHVLCKKDN